MNGINNLAKKYFLSTIWYSAKFSLFLEGPLEFPSKIQFSKIVYNCGETLLLMNGINNLAKSIFLAQFDIVLNFHYFCKVRACRISVKNSILQKLPKIVEKHFSRWQEQIILPKNISLALFEIVQNFHYFCKVGACRISFKNSILQKLSKIVEKHFFWWME